MGVSLVRVETENDINVCFEMIGSNDRMSLDWTNVKHYYKFAAASYGYMWWMMQAPVTHCCKLGYYLQCCNCCRNSESLFIEGDGVFKPNYSAIKAMLNIDDNDVIVFDNRNMIELLPNSFLDTNSRWQKYHFYKIFIIQKSIYLKKCKNIL